MSVVFDGELFADYHQIFVEDSANADCPPGDDRYEVHLWPQASEATRVLKQWVEPGARELPRSGL